MRNSIAVLISFASLAVSAGEVRITALAVEADTAKAVTGIQAPQIEAAASHLTRIDNPHGVTAQQIGALTSEADLAALAAQAAYAATNKTSVLWNEDRTQWETWDASNAVTRYSVSVVSNFTVVTTSDFLYEDVGVLFDFESAFPFTSGVFSGVFVDGVPRITSSGGVSYWYPSTWEGYPATLIGASPATHGTAVVSFELATVTNAVCYLLSTVPPDGLVTTQQLAVTSNALAQSSANAQSVANSAAYDASVAVIDAGNALQLIGGEGGVQESAAAHYNDAGIHVFNDDRPRWDGVTNAAPASVTNAPAWLVYSNVTSAVTVTNLAERPVRIYGGEGVTGLVSFAALREPLPLYVEVQGFLALGFPGAYTVGGGAWQTNQVNIYQVWLSGTNILVNPITTREIY